MSDVSWVNQPGLKLAAEQLRAQARRQEQVFARMYDLVGNLTDPAVFGDDKNGREFFAKWSKDVGDWEDGARDIPANTWSTANAVDLMAAIYRAAHEDAEDIANSVGNSVKNMTPNGFGKVDGPSADGPNTSSGGGNNGGGNHHGRR
ncbi:hypothetical protein [Saccharopolyspora elongata]|uniref:Uncharacterized protein n=1 Tax=Saccharopolyspora elongata TaxID=2530387 RepID=A0A4R4ZCI2_9PSEU|nr:hypothetical protein [Saccharopolyspora elongata]TDD55144.1 hypothetical protein E1288_04820 [Saccharopolyspora elongata]